MLVWRFGKNDVATLRFAISPLTELHCSVRVLDGAASAGMHRWWVARTKRLVDLADLKLLSALQHRDRYSPDFVHPPPVSPLTKLEDEIEMMLRTPTEQIQREIGSAYDVVPDVLQPFMADPAGAISELAGVIGRYWDVAIAPHWSRIRALLEGDILYRGQAMAAGGVQQLLADLHPEARFSEGALSVEKPGPHDEGLRGRGLLLVPSVFIWPRLAVISREPWQPSLIYPARGIGTLWAPAEHQSVPVALEVLIGARRAKILSGLDAPSSTTELGHRIGLSAPSVSQHLRALRAARLVSSIRVGRIVLYTRTELGNHLLSGQT